MFSSEILLKSIKLILFIVCFNMIISKIKKYKNNILIYFQVKNIFKKCHRS